MKTLITLLFLILSHIVFAQLTDPFGKIITHEIKLNKLDNGMYSGAIEWTTGSLDSLQKFIINDLDIKAPVMVSIISKAPDHNVDLSFHKENWEKVESKISTDGEKYATKTFRTMGSAGLGISSKVAGIPYLITVKVGLQFPSTQSLIRITNDKEEYTQHMRKLGYMGQLFNEDGSTSSNTESASTKNSNSNSDNTLMYVIIGLLAIIAILFAIFILKNKSSKVTMLLIISLGFTQIVISQGSIPHNVPPSNMESVFVDYQSTNVENQVPVDYNNPGVRPAMDRTAHVSNDDGQTYQPVELNPNQGSIELSGDEISEIRRRMQEDRDEFNENYGVKSLGERTQGDQRTLPTDRTNEELNRLRRQIQQLQQQVDLLSQQDEEYEDDFDDFDDGGEMILYCEDLDACRSCIQRGQNKFNTHRAYFNFLQKYYLKKATDLNDWIEYGNALSSLPGGGGMAWTPILLHKVRPAMDDLKEAYNKKFDQYIASMEEDLLEISACYGTAHGRIRSRESYEIQMFAVLNALKASKIHK
ncbi:hypothetical protein HNV08_06165 [Winogradskyella eckloniae]|uniref:hypothetical protein n=1 Tax=Winogradskyella eckloniae TaxID=1089306 RepID=UPI00156673FB|nr:hypothetical protein [Winogradskyella eckloniae]NRD19625.1 hypothetical protein [Winogradskyella eckloniae]